ncbi:hypothetical protein E7X19_25030, partial [Bacteroides fragilis]
MRKGIFKYPDNRFGGHLPKRIPEPSETRLSDNSANPAVRVQSYALKAVTNRYLTRPMAANRRNMP